MEPVFLFSAKHLGYLVLPDSRVELTQTLPLPRWACDRCAVAAIRSLRQQQCDGIRISTVYGDYFISFTDEHIVSRPARGRPVEMTICRTHDTPPDASIYLYIADPFWYPRHASTLFYSRAVVNDVRYRLPALKVLNLNDERRGMDKVAFNAVDVLRLHMPLVAKWIAGHFGDEVKWKLKRLRLLTIVSGAKPEWNTTEDGTIVLLTLGHLYPEELLRYSKTIVNFLVQIKLLYEDDKK